MINPMDLTGKKVLVAGASSDIGQSIVIQLSKLGASIIMIDNSEEELHNTLKLLNGEDNAFYAFDLYDNNEIEPQIKQIVNDCGAFHCFVYCAGIGGVRPLSSIKHSFLNSMMNANFYSFIEIVRCITKKNSFVKGGSIVALSSVSSIKGLKSKLAYSSSKAALDASVRCLAAELAEKGIRINTILKGGVSTDNNLDYIKNIVELNNNETIKKQILGETEPEEIANMIAFLLSDAVKTITGTSIILDSGYTL